MTTEYHIVRDTYADSVKLMQIRSDAVESFSLDTAFAVMGTDANKDRLRDAGVFDSDKLEDAGPGDLIMVASGEDKSEALEYMQNQLAAGGETEDSSDGSDEAPKSMYQAQKQLPDTNIALISVPGEYAAREAWKALHNDMHVHLFSDNVSIEDERVLKEYGRENDLLVMGPDCGSAIINSVPLGFANDVDDGAVGVVSASGTGLQEVTSLLDRADVGVSQAIGTGGRDLKNDVGGITMKQGMDALEADDDTEVIVLISKPPEKETMEELLDRVEDCSKPVVVNFLGSSETIESSGATAARTLEETAAKAVGLSSSDQDENVDFDAGIDEFDEPEDISGELADHDLEGRKYIRGLYTGGTLCSEAALMLQDDLDSIESNIGIGTSMDDPLEPKEHAVVDLGEDELTQGRPHPMLQPDLRDEQIQKQLQDDEVLAVLLDVVLGHGVYKDPAGSIADVMEEIPESDRPLVVASVCGTRDDPQDLEKQVQTLKDAGVYVAESNAAAVDMIHTVLNEKGGDQ